MEHRKLNIQMPFPAIACNLDTNVLRAALPLLEGGEVDAIEWSFDTLFQMPEVPDWFYELIEAFSREGRLVGHGVFFSLFSGRWRAEQAAWLRQLEQLCQRFRFDHITEHFGFMTGADFHKGAPLSLPFNKTTLAIGQDRLKRIYNACQCPVGLENLAFAYSLEEVKQHGEFLNALAEPVNGFIILDIHNLYCQLHNFEVAFEEVIGLYPLERVREMHISGGSWEHSDLRPDRDIRRDTHDDGVPEEVFDLLKKALPLCPNVKLVVLEQLGFGLETEASQQQFQQDFRRLKAILSETNWTYKKESTQSFLPASTFELGNPREDENLHQQQAELSAILENANNYEDARNRLIQSSLAKTDWKVESWAPEMLETAVRIAQKWKGGWAD